MAGIDTDITYPTTVANRIHLQARSTIINKQPTFCVLFESILRVYPNYKRVVLTEDDRNSSFGKATTNDWRPDDLNIRRRNDEQIDEDVCERREKCDGGSIESMSARGRQSGSSCRSHHWPILLVCCRYESIKWNVLTKCNQKTITICFNYKVKCTVFICMSMFDTKQITIYYSLSVNNAIAIIDQE
jgi:hypothetical protein